ncbi:hypothetical protein FisN_10Hh151 [Fistulifera solaris]|uniref:Uncharacterized protein n=1 Tax=Fistulifera solaris TaxID=1519565 RepID=A0A1Z5JXK4_FISSO|nr:hypothetical protein FisN_10Hh151 [Fistulifera solaris]|eukprot:GAX18639.1 hypothetical protein FisN_10Hh151 [Fistulifera solaris]
MTTRSITSFLKSPSAVAHALDWGKTAGKTLLNLSITGDKIDLALASHPEFDEPLQQLPSIPLRYETVGNKKTLKAEVGHELAEVLQKFNVCGMVVNWPVQSEGWVGKPAGKVLHTLDQLVANKRVVNSNRPICLWDEEHNTLPEDDWGRTALYSRSTQKSHHVASKEQYKDPKYVAADIWSDYCAAHFPEVSQPLYASKPSYERPAQMAFLAPQNTKKVFASS